VRIRRTEAPVGVRVRLAIDITPLFGLRLRAAQLELRLPTEHELVELAHLAEQGVHPPDEMPFFVAWTDEIGEPGFVDGFVEFHRERRAAWEPDAWELLLGVWAGGALAGVQGALLTEPGVAETGSWLGQRFQRRGLGTAMRAAVLALLFDGLGFDAATSGAIAGNTASARVSEKLGYEPAGEGTASPRGVPVRHRKFRITRELWQARPRPAVEIAGLEPCLPLFGR
jgi:RimJ/RimL family protein N-acetyltransferase